MRLIRFFLGFSDPDLYQHWFSFRTDTHRGPKIPTTSLRYIADLSLFLEWFQTKGGRLDDSSMDLITFAPSEGGRGAIALKDIPVSQAIFFTLNPGGL